MRFDIPISKMAISIKIPDAPVSQTCPDASQWQVHGMFVLLWNQYACYNGWDNIMKVSTIEIYIAHLHKHINSS